MQFVDICNKFAQLLLPQHCLLCESTCDSHICQGCLGDLPRLATAHCPLCALPSPQAEICGNCLKHPPHFDATVAAFEYAFPINRLLQALKYQGQLLMAEFAGNSLAERLTATPVPDIIVPMPLHKSRLQERGFNQATEIARVIGKRLRLPCAHETAIRLRSTEPQAGLPLGRRKKNMRGAFACMEDVSGKRIAIVDDVMTSGASLDELALTLKRAGAVHVSAWVVARTLAD